MQLSPKEFTEKFGPFNNIFDVDNGIIELSNGTYVNLIRCHQYGSGLEATYTVVIMHKLGKIKQYGYKHFKTRRSANVAAVKCLKSNSGYYVGIENLLVFP